MKQWVTTCCDASFTRKEHKNKAHSLIIIIIYEESVDLDQSTDWLYNTSTWTLLSE